MAWTKMTTIAELPPGSLREVQRDGTIFALCNVDGDIRALSGTCPHQGGPLGEGTLNGGVITCPWHMWEFDSATGSCAFNGAIKVSVYSVRVDDQDVLMDLA